MSTETGAEKMHRIIRVFQEYYQPVIPPGVDLVAELLAERRQEAEREQQEMQKYSRTGHTAAWPPTPD